MSTNGLTLSIYWQHAKKYKKKLAIIYPMIVTAQFLEDFLAPLIVAGVLNLLAAGDINALKDGDMWLIIAAIVAIEVISHLLYNTLVRMYWRVQDLILHDLNMTVFNHLQTMSYKFFADRFAGSIVSQTNKFVGSFERLADALTWNVFRLIVYVIFTSIILLPRVPLISLTIVLVASIYVPLIWFYRKKQIPYNTRQASAETDRTGQLADAVSNIIAVKSFSGENQETKRMLDKSADVFDRSMDTMKINMNQELTSGSVERSINVIVIAIAIGLAINGVVGVGTIYLALTFTAGLLTQLWNLNKTFRSFARVFGDARDMTLILQIAPEVKDPSSPLSFSPEKGEIDFTAVDFAYQDGESETKLFSGLNLNIKPGQKVGLVGPSGGGKTTITKLMLRFMDIQSGSIKIDGTDISKVNQQELRRFISYVPQEPLLFHRSLTENIAYGQADSDKSLVVEAAKNAHAHEFITKLADGYDTLVGERGVKLSGGQKQRVAIARAMIKDAPILLLDEATSALDSESENLIQDALWKLMEDRTAIVIAHRLSTIQKMDRIIVLDGGKIVEEGTHKGLIKKKNGLYARLWSHQSGGFLPD